MSVSMTANSWWKLLSNYVMWLFSCRMCLLVVTSTADACPVRFSFAILVNRVFALVLLYGGVSARFVPDLVLCAGDVVLITVFLGSYLFFMVLCLTSVDCSTLGTTGVDTV